MKFSTLIIGSFFIEGNIQRIGKLTGHFFDEKGSKLFGFRVEIKGLQL